MSEKTLSYLENIFNESNYTVALCGSGCLKECGVVGLKTQEYAYEIEKKYGDSPEYLYTSSYFSSRPKQFFDFYRKELLEKIPEPGPTGKALAALEKAGKVHCVITGNIFNLSERSGCKNVINLHGNIFNNYCTACGHNHSVEYMKSSHSIPLCEKCGHIIRPGVSFFGDMVDNALITRSLEEVEKADVLVLLGTSLRSEVFRNYLNYFSGNQLVIIHEESDISDKNADIVIYSEPNKPLQELASHIF